MNKRGSLFHISKRDTLPLPKALAIRGGIILLALVFCGLFTTLLTGENPINVYGPILKGAFGTVRKSWVTWQNVAILLGISLAVTPAFKMRFWNIGAEGQTLIGCLASAACMITLGKTLPNALLILVSLVAALLAEAGGKQLTCVFVDHGRMRLNEGDEVECAYDGASAVELARKAGAFVFGICNVVGSSIARATD